MKHEVGQIIKVSNFLVYRDSLFDMNDMKNETSCKNTIFYRSNTCSGIAMKWSVLSQGNFAAVTKINLRNESVPTLLKSLSLRSHSLIT